MLRPFWGEFMVSPIPLELSLNYCSHKCAYCFANISNPERKADIKGALRSLAEAGKRNTALGKMIAEKRPIVCSNLVDPFAHSNYKQALPLLETVIQSGFQVFYQTKFGKGAREYFEKSPPSLVYCSISFNDDALRKKIEPGATSVIERVEMIQFLTALGYTVVVGINPAVPEWLPNPERLIGAVKDAGAVGVWAECLHFNKRQIARITPAEKKAMGEGVVLRAQGRESDSESALLAEIMALCHGGGLDFFRMQYHAATNFQAHYRRHSQNTFPTNQDFVNWCYQNKGEGPERVTFDEYLSCVGPLLPEFVLNIENYIRVPSRRVFLKSKIPAVMSYKECLRWAWNDFAISFSPSRHGCFALLINNDGDYILDSNGNRVYVFARGRFENLYWKES